MKRKNIVLIIFLVVFLLLLSSCGKRECNIYFENTADGVSSNFSLPKISANTGDNAFDLIKIHLDENNKDNKIYDKDKYYLAYCFYSKEDGTKFISKGEMPKDYNLDTNIKIRFQFYEKDRITFLYSSTKYKDYPSPNTITSNTKNIQVYDFAPYKKGYYFTGWKYDVGSVFSGIDYSGKDVITNKTDFYKDSNNNLINVISLKPKWLKKGDKNLIKVTIKDPTLKLANGIKPDKEEIPDSIYNKNSSYYTPNILYLEKGSKMPIIKKEYQIPHFKFSHFTLPNGDEVIENNTEFYEDVTISPHFIEDKRITIKFSNKIINDITIYENDNLAKYDILSIPIPKDSNNFITWQEEITKEELTSFIKHKKDKTYYPIYKEDNYKIVEFIDSDIPRLFVKSGYILEKPQDPRPNGNYVFTGWTNSSGISIKFPITVKEDLKIKANWLYFMDTFKIRKEDDGILITGTKIEDKYQKIRIPEKYNNTPIIGITGDGFKNCTQLEEIIIPSSVKIFSEDVFSNTKFLQNALLNDLVIINNVLVDLNITKEVLNEKDMQNVLSISPFAFKNKIYLKEVFIPKSITKIEDGLFKNLKKLEKVILPDTTKEIGDYAFSGCSNLSNIDISSLSSLEKIGDYAFSETSILPGFKVPNHLISFGYMSFYKTPFYEALKNEEGDFIIINDILLEIKENASSKITIPDNVKIINSYVLTKDGNKNIKFLNILHNVIIKDYAFYGASNLERLYLNENVKKVGAFIVDFASNLIKNPNNIAIEVTQNIHNDFHPNWNKYYDKGTNIEKKYRTKWNNEIEN